MKAYLSLVLGLVAVIAPSWYLTGFVVTPAHRTGTIADFAFAIILYATLYGGVFAGVLIDRRFRLQKRRASVFRTTFIAGMTGAMGAITLALAAGFLNELITTGRLMPKGNNLALLPVVYIVGGLVSAFLAAGAGLIAYSMSGEAKGDETE